MRKLNCIVCGKPAEVGSYCEEHYVERKHLFSLPASIEVEVCRMCESPFMGNDKITMEEALKREMKINGEMENFTYSIKQNVVTITAKGKVEGIEKEETHSADFRPRKRMCLDCQKRSGGYFEATVQIRPKFEWALRRLNNVEEIVNVEEIREGYDVFLINKASANKVAARLSKWIIDRKDTRKLYGEKGGMSVYRNVTLLRLRDKEKNKKEEE